MKDVKIYITSDHLAQNLPARKVYVASNAIGTFDCAILDSKGRLCGTSAGFYKLTKH